MVSRISDISVMMDIQEQISTDRLSMHFWQRLKPEELEQ